MLQWVTDWSFQDSKESNESDGTVSRTRNWTRNGCRITEHTIIQSLLKKKLKSLRDWGVETYLNHFAWDKCANQDIYGWEFRRTWIIDWTLVVELYKWITWDCFSSQLWSPSNLFLQNNGEYKMSLWHIQSFITENISIVLDMWLTAQ